MFINLLAIFHLLPRYIINKIQFVFVLIALLSTSFFAQAISINQTYEEALQAFHQEEFQDSIIHIKNILKVEPNHLPSRVLMAENLLAQGKASTAEVELNYAIAAGADSFRITPLLAKSYLLQNNYQRILDIYIPDKSTAAYKSTMHTYFGYAYLGQRYYPMAKKAFNQALTLLPDNIDALLGLAKISIHKEDTDHALTLIEQVLIIEPEHKQALLMASIAYKLMGNLTVALITVNQLIDLDNNNYSALLTRAMLFSSLDQNEKATADLDIIIKHFPNEPIANYVRLITSQSLQDNDTSKKLELHLMTVLAAISVETKSEQPVFLFLTGLVNFQNDAMENARTALLKYHKLAPKDIAGMKLLARTQMALGDYFSATKYLVKAYLLDESNVDIWALLGRSYMMTNELDKAEFYFIKVVNSRPNDLTAVIDLATLYLLNENYIAIQALLEPVAAIKSDNEKNNTAQKTQVLIMLIKALQKINLQETAITYSHKLLKIAAQNSYSHQVHGNLLAVQGDITQAKDYFIKAIELDSNNFQAVMYLARVEALLGNINQSISLLKSALEAGPNSALYIELGDVYQGIKDNETSMVWFDKALAYNPSSILALNKIVSTNIQANQLDEAIATTENYIQSFDKNAQAYRLLAQLYQQQGLYKKALTAMNRYVKLSTDRADAYYQLAQLQLASNATVQAELSLKKSIAWNNDYQPAYLLLFSLYSKNKAEEKALKLINDLSLTSENKSLITRLKGDLYWEITQPDTALPFYQQSYKIKPNREALLGIFRIYRSHEKYALISDLLGTWLNENPNDLTLAISLAENYRQQDNLNKASIYYQTLIEQHADNPVLLNNAAIVYRELEKYDLAAELSELAYQLMPQNVIILDTKAWIEYHRGNANNALALLRKANTLDYENAEVKYHLAVTLAELNRKKEAKKYLKESVRSQQVYPEKSEAKALLATW